MSNLVIGRIGSEEILKVDARGRVRVRPERMEMLLDEFERSAMSAHKFARYVGVNTQTFHGWVSKRRKKGRQTAVTALEKPKWIEAVVDGAEGRKAEVVRIELPGGAVMHLENAGQVGVAATLLRALEKGAATC